MRIALYTVPVVFSLYRIPNILVLASLGLRLERMARQGRKRKWGDGKHVMAAVRRLGHNLEKASAA